MEQWEYLIEKYRFQIALVLILMIIGSGSLLLSRQNFLTKITDDGSKRMIRVDVEGAVKKPGVYELKAGSIVFDAIKAAGGFSKKADREKVGQEINQAALLFDGEKIYIPFRNQNKKSADSKSDIKLININTASLAELDSLPGIGPVYAQRIIDYRKRNGRFKSIEEIMEVSGIGKSIFEKIKNLITI